MWTWHPGTLDHALRAPQGNCSLLPAAQSRAAFVACTLCVKKGTYCPSQPALSDGAQCCHDRSCLLCLRLVLRTRDQTLPLLPGRLLPTPPPVFWAVCWELPPVGSSLPSTCLRPVSVLCSLVDSLALLPALWWGGAPPGCGPGLRRIPEPQEAFLGRRLCPPPQRHLGGPCVSAQLCSCVPSQAP